MINLRKKMFDYLNRQEKVSKKGIIVPYKQKRILVWNVKKGLWIPTTSIIPRI